MLLNSRGIVNVINARIAAVQKLNRALHKISKITNAIVARLNYTSQLTAVVYTYITFIRLLAITSTTAHILNTYLNLRKRLLAVVLPQCMCNCRKKCMNISAQMASG